MKQLTTWGILIGKRLCKKTLFLFSLLLIPLFALGLQLCVGSHDSAVKVALFTDGSAAENALENRLTARLSECSTRAISFYQCDSIKQLQYDVRTNKASCGYVFPENMADLLAEHIQNRKPVITIYRHKGEFTSRLVDEVVYSQIYPEYAYELVRQHIRKQTGSVDEKKLSRLYEQNCTGYTFIEYEYADGTKNSLLSDDSANYMLFPLRGLTAVCILLAGLTGTLFWSIDRERRVFVWLKTGTHRIKVLYLFIPTALSGLLGVITLTVNGLCGSVIGELVAMLCYTVAVVGFCDFVSCLAPKSTAFSGVIPIATVGSVFLSPVFVDLTSIAPAIRFLRLITPVTHYLTGLYSLPGRWGMLLYGIVGIAAASLLQKHLIPQWR